MKSRVFSPPRDPEEGPTGDPGYGERPSQGETLAEKIDRYRKPGTGGGASLPDRRAARHSRDD